MRHDFDPWFWCRHCGLGEMETMQTEHGYVCMTPPSDVLAQRQLDAIVARAPLVRIAEFVHARLEDSGILP